MYASAVERGAKKAHSPVFRTLVLAIQAGLQVSGWDGKLGKGPGNRSAL
jgi:hypothetical protein